MDNARCPFEKAILGAQCACEMATRFSVAEQMGVECRSDIARNNCAMLLGFMRERARFALKVTDTSVSLPFGKEMKVMLGGLIGLQRQMTPDEGAAATPFRGEGRLPSEAKLLRREDARPPQETRSLSRPAATAEGACATRGGGRVQNIHALVQEAQAVYGSLESLPYHEIVKSIVSFQSRRRGRARPSR